MGKVKHWAVRIDINGENVLNIESGCLSGIDDITEYRQTILNCAEHLKSFIGTENTPFFMEENSNSAKEQPSGETNNRSDLIAEMERTATGYMRAGYPGTGTQIREWVRQLSTCRYCQQ